MLGKMDPPHPRVNLGVGLANGRSKHNVFHCFLACVFIADDSGQMTMHSWFTTSQVVFGTPVDV